MDLCEYCKKNPVKRKGHRFCSISHARKAWCDKNREWSVAHARGMYKQFIIYQTKLHMAYLKKLIGNKEHFSRSEAAKLAHKAFRDGRLVGYKAGYEKASGYRDRGRSSVREFEEVND